MDSTRARVRIYRSNTGIIAQLIMDGKTLAGQRFVFEKKAKPLDQAKSYGEEFGKRIIKAGHDKISYDRGRFLYHGIVQAFADGVRASGVKF